MLEYQLIIARYCTSHGTMIQELQSFPITGNKDMEDSAITTDVSIIRTEYTIL